MPNNERPKKKQKKPNETENKTEWIDEKKTPLNFYKLSKARQQYRDPPPICVERIDMSGWPGDQASFSPIGGHFSTYQAG